MAAGPSDSAPLAGLHSFSTSCRGSAERCRTRDPWAAVEGWCYDSCLVAVRVLGLTMAVSFREERYESYFRHGERWQAGTVAGQAIIQHAHHWVAIVVDQCGDEQATTPVHYVLRSEVLASILLLRRQWEADGPIKVSTKGQQDKQPC